MAKEVKKTREELIAEANAKKTEAPAENLGAPDENVADDQENPADPPLSPEAQAEADRIAASEEGSNATIDDEPDDNEKAQKARRQKIQDAYEKLQLIATAYPRTTPDEHTVFGFGGHVFKLGDLRALFEIPGPRG